ncbi:aminotransferase class V-fold PLP-dependent enzyme [Segeticoccus rhizosphaerae]|uniref:aminotransferase class V-fold PLP-dependent enzyme n=1 Tax=Segeticoccus rhizosphaerae TaxID=1104777 RepID=UPI0012651202|nr:aminotransferase class V-fold PLP-dependent enzyme [Segeticoccus rhizosphaerae]
MRDSFSLDPAITHVNHGSYGAVPIVVQEEQQRWRRRAEANPMRFNRIEKPEQVARARAVGAAFLDVESDAIALVRNVTEAVSTVLCSLAGTGELGRGDVILVNSQGYGAVQRAAQRWCDRTGAGMVTVDVPVGVTDDELVAAHRRVAEEVIGRGGRVRLVVIDHVTSPTGRVLPVTELTRLAREFGALSFVDAAHVPGQLLARPAGSGADYWTGTWHKWGYAPRGTTVLWVAPARRESCLPLTTSWAHGEPFPGPFDMRGTDDYSAWLSLPAALDFWESAGGPVMAQRATTLLDDAAVLVTKAFAEAGYAVTSPSGGSHPAPQLRLLALPDGVAATGDAADELYERLSAASVEAQVLWHAGRGWLRLSAAPYNDLEDYARLAEALVAEIGSMPAT